MTSLDVHIADSGLVGQAHVTRNRRALSTTFLYDAAYLAGNGSAIDPALPLDTGAQYQPGLVRAFADSAPDRWGRNLIDKAERVRAREENRNPRSLDDLDYLLGVSDDTRQGALRFTRSGSAEFLGRPSHVPQLISLPQLLRAADDLAADADPAEAIKQLLDTGTTGLGGARPKALVRLEDGALAIAKFPHASDRWDIMAWEALSLDLLEHAGVRTPERRLTQVGERNVLLLRRFDRSGTSPQRRIGYISAMTALGASDGDNLDYSEIGQAVRDLSLSPREDHHELFDRVVMSVLLGNTDDHLRNHGFLTVANGWKLSPAFDVNPNPDLERARSTSIMGADTWQNEAEALPALAEELSLTAAQGKDRMRRASEALEGWERQAQALGIAAPEIDMMAESITPRQEAVRAASS